MNLKLETTVSMPSRCRRIFRNTRGFLLHELVFDLRNPNLVLVDFVQRLYDEQFSSGVAKDCLLGI